MSSKCFLCEENMFLREHFQYFCLNCNNFTVYCLRCNKHLETLLNCAFFRCSTCKRLVRTTKIESICVNNNEIFQHLFRNNTQDQQSFRHYFSLGESNPPNINFSSPIIQPQINPVNSCWVNSDKKGTGSKGNFIIMGNKENEHNFFNSQQSNPTMIPSGFPFSTSERPKENKFGLLSSSDQNISVPNVLNLTDDLSKKCNLTMENKKENVFTANLLNHSATEMRSLNNANNYNLLKPKSLLRQAAEDASSKVGKVSASKNYKVAAKFSQYVTNSPKITSASKLDSSVFSAYNKSESKALSKSPSVSHFKESTIKKNPNNSLFSEI